ncbi:MAG: phytoene desaturase family protein, partial [Candidatus Competibacterales bacterium]
IHHRGQINTPLAKDEWQRAFEAAQRGEIPQRLWTELYFQTAHDQSVAPPGVHTMSVFAQYAPYHLARGDWDSRRREIGWHAVDAIAHHCSNLPDAVLDLEVKGPPDIEAHLGLRGGHIFQGSCMPDHMWDRRLPYRTPMAGVYLCGACTHPGGSVIAVNGRNAALTVLADPHGRVSGRSPGTQNPDF